MVGIFGQFSSNFPFQFSIENESKIKPKIEGSVKISPHGPFSWNAQFSFYFWLPFFILGFILQFKFDPAHFWLPPPHHSPYPAYPVGFHRRSQCRRAWPPRKQLAGQRLHAGVQLLLRSSSPLSLPCPLPSDMGESSLSSARSSRGYMYSGTLPKRGWVSSSTQCRSWEDVQHSLDTSQLGEVMNAMSHVTTTLYSQPPPSMIPQPAPILHPHSLSCRPCLAYPISAETPRDTDPTWPNTSAYELTPTCWA